MRVYFEKPRTTVGWKGLINDPRLDGSFSINEGIRIAREVLLDINDMGMPAGCEFLQLAARDLWRHASRRAGLLFSRRQHHRRAKNPRDGNH